MAEANRVEITMGEEIANSITHGFGWAMAVIALVLLVFFSSLEGDPWYITAGAVYGSGLVLLYASSTLYHSIQARRAKMVFKIIDHSSIFFLIAATYTAYTLTVLRGLWGWVLFGIVWAGFILGTVFKVFFSGRFKALSITIYVVLGWCALLAFKPLMDALAFEGFLLLVAGGIAYSLGALVYAKRKVRYSHSVWHMFVLAGSMLHFLSVFFYVVR
ncbi:MAG: PAQR family membrane homeostasis protein TrhA [Thermoplasmatota archaeon]